MPPMPPADDGRATTRILMVDDDRKLCGLVREYLAPFGFEVSAAHTGAQGLRRARDGDFAAVILDVMLPEMDGFEVLRELRRSSDVPVLMLTARGEETDRIVGLEMGADDYLPKTFSTRELLARLRAVTRRSRLARESGEAQPQPVALEVGEITIDPGARTARVGDRAVDLTPVEFDLLLCMAQAAGRVLTREYLLEQVAGRDYDLFDRSVDVHISSLRRKLGDQARAPRYIKTVRTVGYMLLPGS